MAEYLTTWCMLTCTMGAVPAPFVTMPLPGKTQHMGALPGALITDIVPLVNIPTFVMCRAPSNPTVIAATTAAMGVPTPGACLPVPASGWFPPAISETYCGLSKALISSKCLCAYGGTIAPTMAIDMTMTTAP